jgi:hypothetical protein
MWVLRDGAHHRLLRAMLETECVRRFMLIELWVGGLALELGHIA